MVVLEVPGLPTVPLELSWPHGDDPTPLDASSVVHDAQGTAGRTALDTSSAIGENVRDTMSSSPAAEMLGTDSPKRVRAVASTGITVFAVGTMNMVSAKEVADTTHVANVANVDSIGKLGR